MHSVGARSLWALAGALFIAASALLYSACNTTGGGSILLTRTSCYDVIALNIQVDYGRGTVSVGGLQVEVRSESAGCADLRVIATAFTIFQDRNANEEVDRGETIASNSWTGEAGETSITTGGGNGTFDQRYGGLRYIATVELNNGHRHELTGAF